MLKKVGAIMKKVVIFLLIISVLMLSFCSCNKTPYGLSEGIYKAKISDECALAPTVSFDMQNYTFTFSYDPFSSYLAVGEYEIKNGKVIAETTDGNYTYIFKIIDNDTIAFIEKGSSDIKMTVEGEKPTVTDGTEFIFTED